MSGSTPVDGVEAFRFDTRAPEAIAREGGFEPNSEMPARTLIEHSVQFQQGSGNFISFGEKPGNLLELLDFIKLTPVQDARVTKSVLQTAQFFKLENEKYVPAKYTQRELQQAIAVNTLETYEYRVTGISGAKTGQSGVAGENEIVTTHVSVTNIVSYRKVSVVRIAGWKESYSGVVYGPWRRF